MHSSGLGAGPVPSPGEGNAVPGSEQQMELVLWMSGGALWSHCLPQTGFPWLSIPEEEPGPVCPAGHLSKRGCAGDPAVEPEPVVQVAEVCSPSSWHCQQTALFAFHYLSISCSLRVLLAL